MTLSTELLKAAYTPSLSDFPEGSFFDADYFERGKQTGKGWLENYRWMPRRSFREALAIIDYMGLDNNSKLLDVGCAKGFLVRAMRELGIPTDGCDISAYALSFAPAGCWNGDIVNEWKFRQGRYTHAFAKDVLEHNTLIQLANTMEVTALVAPVFMCVVPMGDNGRYRIHEYHSEISHLIAENEDWWRETFDSLGWKVIKETNHVPGIKDNWQGYGNGIGNRAFLLEKV